MIRGITFSEQPFYSADFAHYQNFFLNRQSGITKGCRVTQDGVSVTIGTGYFIACGRLLNVEEAETIDENAGFAEGYNRIVYEIDLGKKNTITEFVQGAVKALHTESLIQEDLDAGGKVYQMPFCHFQWDGTGISDFVIDAPTLVLDNIFADVSANFAIVNQQMQAWMEGQKEAFDEYAGMKKADLDGTVSAAEAIIERLEADGFEKSAAYIDHVLAADNWDAENGTYSFEAEYPAEKYNVQVYAAPRITQEELEALGGAMLVGSTMANVYTAKGDVPKMDIPIILKVVEKVR